MRPPFAFVVMLGGLLSAMPLTAQNPASGRPAADTAAVLPSVALPPELDRVLRDYEREWRAGNAAGLASLFAEDGFVLQGGRAPVRGRAAIRAAYANVRGSPLRLRALAYHTADSVGYIIGAYGYGDGSGDMGKFTLTLLRDRSGRWLIFSDMDNSSVPPRPQGTPPGDS